MGKNKSCMYCNDTVDSFGRYVSTYCHCVNRNIMFADSSGNILFDKTDECENCESFIEQQCLEDVAWKKDAVTRNYVKKWASFLKSPILMERCELAEAITHCEKIDNPYSKELSKRAGLLGEYVNASTDKERCDVVRQAADSFGIKLL